MLRINFLFILRKSVNFSVILSSKRKMNSTSDTRDYLLAWELYQEERRIYWEQVM